VAGAGRDIRSFHVRVGDRMAARAAQLARSLGFRHEEVALDGAEVRADLLHLLAAQDLPSVDGVNTYLIAQAIRKAGLKAAVTGLGADELFLGYTLHRTYVRARTLQAEGAFGAPLRFAAGVLSRWKADAPARGPLAGWQLDKALGLASVQGARGTYAAARALFPAAIAAQLQPDYNYNPAAPRGILPPGASPVAEVTRLELSTYLVDTLLRDADVMGMAHGVELRVPMLDRRLVEAVVALPGGLKLRRGRQKALLVDAVPELPTELTRATKEGFELPLEEWLSGPLREPVESLLCTPTAATRVGLAPTRVADVWQRFLGRRDRPSAFRAWALYSLLEWARAHGASV
jgi:asparagine synthase (glutamine-hydrolysing)